MGHSLKLKEVKAKRFTKFLIEIRKTHENALRIRFGIKTQIYINRFNRRL